MADPRIDALGDALKRINEILWTVEGDIRECERQQDFGPRFIELARAGYRDNDERSALKREISVLSGSAIVGEKSYSTIPGDPLART